MPATASRPRVSRADAVTVFHALSDETRLAVLEMLRGGERCVCDLQDAVGAAQSRLSFHLKVLKDAGLVTDRREGRWSYYALERERIEEAQAALGALAIVAPGRDRPLALHAIGRASRDGAGSTKRSTRDSRARTTTGRDDDCC